MITVMGATGHTGRATAEALLARKLPIRVIGRNDDRLRPLVERGAEAAVGDASDLAFLTSAFEGAGAVYAMVPPDIKQPDLRKYYNRFGETIAQAVERAKVGRLVFLSSLGAELPDGTGPIKGLHDLEDRFRDLQISLTILRPGAFYENFYASLGLIKEQGLNGGAIEPEARFAMTATQDIGAAAAEELTRAASKGVMMREVLGPRDYSMSETTRILGGKIGKPDLKYVRFPDAAYVQALMGFGFSRGVAELFIEMSQALSSGRIKPREGRTPKNTGPTSFESFADRLAAAYQAL